MHLPAGQRAFDSLMLETFLRVQEHMDGVEADSWHSGIRFGTPVWTTEFCAV